MDDSDLSNSLPMQLISTALDASVSTRPWAADDRPAAGKTGRGAEATPAPSSQVALSALGRQLAAATTSVPTQPKSAADDASLQAPQARKKENKEKRNNSTPMLELDAFRLLRTRLRAALLQQQPAPAQQEQEAGTPS